MKIYVIIENNYGYFEILGIFDDKQKAEALNLPIHRYNLIKLKIGIVTTNLFNEEEMQKIIKESSKANLSPKEYISNKILK